MARFTHISFLSLLAIISLWSILSCSGPRHSQQLLKAEAIIATHPDSALIILQSLSRDNLSDADRHFADFLTIKAKDKAYIYHTSDSLILDVLSYASSHQSEGYYPEALYYAGRVYSDLGDSPNALIYFQKALEELYRGQKNFDLESRILSQTGRLLNVLHLPDEAAVYMATTIKLDSIVGDTVNWIYDLQLLGHTLIRAKDFKGAEATLKAAVDLESIFPEDLGVNTQMYYAYAKYKTGDLDSALLLIRGIPERADSLDRNGALAYAAQIYHKAGIKDTAYIYADRLIHSSDKADKEIGYQTILQPALRNLLPPDSLDPYLSAYASILNSYHDSHQAEMALLQQAHYNYEIQQRDRLKAEQAKDSIRTWLIAALLGLLLAVIGILYTRKRYLESVIKYRQALDQVKKLKGQLEDMTLLTSISKASPSKEDIQEELRKELLSLVEKDGKREAIDSNLFTSDAYAQLQEYISQRKMLKETDLLWAMLEEAIEMCSPGFRKKLFFLSSGKLSEADVQFLLLIKCGIRPVNMMSLLGKTNGAIISRRESVSKKLFISKVPAKEFTKIIRCL